MSFTTNQPPLQTYLEIHHDDPRYDIIEDKWTVFEHGGSLFSFTSSLIFLLVSFVLFQRNYEAVLNKSSL